MDRRSFIRRGLGTAFALGLSGTVDAKDEPAFAHQLRGLREHIDHVVVIFQENRSFDHYFGAYQPRSRSAVLNLLDRTGSVDHRFLGMQRDLNGTAYRELPMTGLPVLEGAHLPNLPFALDPYWPASRLIDWDPGHRFFRMRAEIDGGRMDHFVALAGATYPHRRGVPERARAGGAVIGFYTRAQLAFYHALADDYVLFDRFFQAASGGSTLNALYLVAGRSCTNPGAPVSARSPVAAIAASGDVPEFYDRPYDADGVLINDLPPLQGPTVPRPALLRLAPPPALQRWETIGDRLSAAGHSWAWYNEHWSRVSRFALKTAFGPGEGSAVVDDPRLYVPHHNPFQYVARWPRYVRDGHMRDSADFVEDARLGQLPAVSFIKASALHDEHPAGSAPQAGMTWVQHLLHAVAEGPAWERTAVFITYDEGGGYWDHVRPPRRDAYGNGTRVPALLVSGRARKGYIDGSTADSGSILRFIGLRFGLAPLNARDRHAYPLLAGFDFVAPPRDPVGL